MVSFVGFGYISRVRKVNAKIHVSNGTRRVKFDLCLHPCLLYARSEDSDEITQKRRLVLAVAAHIYGKYPNLNALGQ